MSTVASLSFFLFTLPAGVLADKVDRQKLVCTINLSLAAMALGLAVLGWLHLLNPYLILVCMFFIGIGFAFNAPAWTSIMPQVVSDAELPSAATLSGLQLNISGIIGPALGGLLVLLAGAKFVFAVNAVSFLVVVRAIRRWKQPTVLAKVPSESCHHDLAGGNGARRRDLGFRRRNRGSKLYLHWSGGSLSCEPDSNRPASYSG